MLEIHKLTKRYGDVTAVDTLSFTARPGIVSGFLGPNGAGKSTTMRMILGLDRPTSGTVSVTAAATRAPPRLPRTSGRCSMRSRSPRAARRNHLLTLGATVGIGSRRVDEVLDVVGQTDVARQAAGSFPLGIGQRLGIASALLAIPPSCRWTSRSTARPRRHPVDPHPADRPRSRGPGRVRVLAPDEGDGADPRLGGVPRHH